MSKIEIILSVMLLLSVAINIGLFVYAKHLNEVYELETFYGDQTLHSLLEHAVSFNEHIETFEHIYHLIEEEIEQEPDPTDASEPE